LPGDDEKVGDEGLSSHEVWTQKGEALALACVSELIAGGERERLGVDKVGRRGSIREVRTPQHVLGHESASLVCGEEACAEVSIGRPKAASMSSLKCRHVGGLATGASSAVARRGVRLRACVWTNTCTDLA
jgi:hypothetical protein